MFPADAHCRAAEGSSGAVKCRGLSPPATLPQCSLWCSMDQAAQLSLFGGHVSSWGVPSEGWLWKENSQHETGRGPWNSLSIPFCLGRWLWQPCMPSMPLHLLHRLYGSSSARVAACPAYSCLGGLWFPTSLSSRLTQGPLFGFSTLPSLAKWIPAFPLLSMLGWLLGSE